MDCWIDGDGLCERKDCQDGVTCIQSLKLNRLYDEAFMSPFQRRRLPLFADSEDLDAFRKLADICKTPIDFVKEGKSLYIHSTNCGNGKTSWALRLMQSYFNSIWRTCTLGCHGMFISVPRLLRELKENISQRSEYVSLIKDNLISSDLVVWDDIATRQASAFDAEQLLSMIDSRINAGKSNVFTSNLTDDELHSFVGDRLASRIIGATYNIELHGADKRGINQ